MGHSFLHCSLFQMTPFPIESKQTQQRELKISFCCLFGRIIQIGKCFLVLFLILQRSKQTTKQLHDVFEKSITIKESPLLALLAAITTRYMLFMDVFSFRLFLALDQKKHKKFGFSLCDVLKLRHERAHLDAVSIYNHNIALPVTNVWFDDEKEAAHAVFSILPYRGNLEIFCLFALSFFLTQSKQKTISR